MDDLATLATDFAAAIGSADQTRPVATNQRTGISFQAGIGPHSESATVRLAVASMKVAQPSRYNAITYDFPYPTQPRQKCDVVFGEGAERLFVEAKLFRLLGDNGKPNDNMLMHILSPYSPHRSAVTDCEKLRQSGLPGRKAILIFGYDNDQWPLLPGIEAFEVIARHRGQLGTRHTASFGDLCHAIHSRGAVFVWEVMGG